jgi:ribosome-binding factor A
MPEVDAVLGRLLRVRAETTQHDRAQGPEVAHVLIRRLPELSFEADTSFDRMDRTREILSSPDVKRDLD